MTLLKDEATMRLDDVSRAADEACALYEDLLERLESPALKALVAAHIDAERARAERLADIRRNAGQLPQAGDPERGLLHAAGAMLRAAALPGDTDLHFVESMEQAAAEVSAELARALELELDPALTAELHRLREENDAFTARLREALSR